VLLAGGAWLTPLDLDDVEGESAVLRERNRLTLARWHARVCAPLQEPSRRQGWHAVVWQKECRPRRVRWVRRCNGCFARDCTWVQVVDP
jgi:hypothetical protein